ncbi:MAG: ankyrin repeat domain-containing protein, partial [Candidatus Micrarchaeota archaeon]|nr:ankyrin repeat domain-containing protein [Candidatus Micrarchaeota archaeon]
MNQLNRPKSIKKAAEHINLTKQKLSTEKRVIGPEKQRQLNQMLIEAAKNGKLERIRRLLKAGADVNVRFDKGYTLLIYVACTGERNTRICGLLIENGADVNARIEGNVLKDKTALMFAANNGDTKMCRLLIEHGADVNAKDDNTRTVLMETVYGGHTETCKLLIEKGADIGAKFEEGKHK